MTVQSNKQQYDIHAYWDDPFEKKPDNRKSQRVKTSLKIKMVVEYTDQPFPMVGGGMLLDISSSGMNCRTKHRLKPGQRMKVSIPTEESSKSLSLPKRFMGNAVVLRVNQEDEAISEVALKFEEDITQDLDFVYFVDQLLLSSQT